MLTNDQKLAIAKRVDLFTDGAADAGLVGCEAACRKLVGLGVATDKLLGERDELVKAAQRLEAQLVQVRAQADVLVEIIAETIAENEKRAAPGTLKRPARVRRRG